MGDAQLRSSDNHCDTAPRLFMMGETTVRKQGTPKAERERATLDLEREGRSLALARRGRRTAAFPGKHCIERSTLSALAEYALDGGIHHLDEYEWQGVMCTRTYRGDGAE